MQRRRFLTTTALVLPITLAGCLGDSEPAGNGNENGGDTSPNENGTGFEYEIKQLGFLMTAYRPFESDSVGHIEVFESAEEAHETLPSEGLTDADEQSNEEFIEDTDFDTELLLYIATKSPKINFAEIEVRELDRDDDTITGTAASVGAEEGDDAPSYPLALIRMFVGDDRPSSVEMTVIDGSENEGTLEVDIS
jgi:hypothetical protein